LAGNRGYRAYRGKSSRKKGILAIFLVLVILAAIVVAFLQKNMVYDETGSPHLEVPWQQEEENEEPVELDLVIHPAETQEVFRGYVFPPTELFVETCQSVLRPDSPWDAAALVLKDSTGAVYYDSAQAAYNTSKAAEETEEVLRSLTAAERELHTIAKIACFHDPKAANGDIEGMALMNTGGFMFYDGNNSQWLDPAKETARQYLYGILREAAELGFQEILLTDVSYPTVGSVDKIQYGTGLREDHLAEFLREARAELAPYGVKLSVEVPVDVILNGQNEVAGLVLEKIAPEVDRICAVVLPEQVEACAEAVRTACGETEFLPILTDGETLPSGSYLIG